MWQQMDGCCAKDQDQKRKKKEMGDTKFSYLNA